MALSQRELEARVLLKTAQKLQALRDNWDPSICTIEEPLSNNRKLWEIFLASAMEDDCPLPPELRRNVIGLGRFVINRCMQILLEPEASKLDLLIEINHSVAAGLMAKMPAEAAAVPAPGQPNAPLAVSY